MSRVVRWVRENPRLVNGAALGSLLFVVVRTCLLGVAELVPFGAEVGELLSDVALAYVTAWVFNLLVVVVPDSTRAMRVDRIVVKHVDEIIKLGYQTAQGLAEAAGTTFKAFPVSLPTIQSAIDKVDPEDDFPGWGDNWRGVLLHIMRRAELRRTNLKPFYPLLDLELLALLEEEESSASQISFALRVGTVMPRRNLNDLAKPLQNWLAAIHVLLDLRSTSLAKEIEPPRLKPLGGVLLTLDQIERDYATMIVAKD